MRRPHSREAEDVGSDHLDHRSLALQSARQIRQGLCPRLRKTAGPAEYTQLAWCQTAKSCSCAASECHGLGFLS